MLCMQGMVSALGGMLYSVLGSMLGSRAESLLQCALGSIVESVLESEEIAAGSESEYGEHRAEQQAQPQKHPQRPLIDVEDTG